MTDTLPKLHTCKNCGFMSMRGRLFEMVGDKLLCKACIDQPIKPFYREITESNIARVEAKGGTRSTTTPLAVLQS